MGPRRGARIAASAFPLKPSPSTADTSLGERTHSREYPPGRRPGAVGMEPTVFFRLLRGALRSVQLYPADSPVVRRAAAAFHRAVAELASGRPEGVSVCFLDDGSYLDGRPARALAPGDDAGSPGDVYAAGLRELRFLDEVTVEEVESLLRPLSRALLGQLNPVDEDLSLQLWEADLPHIAYLLYEGPAPIEPEVSEEVTVEQQDPGIEAFLAEGSPFPGGSPSASGLRLAEDERMRILTAFRCEEESDLPFKFGRLLLDILRSEPAEGDTALTAEALRDHLQALQRQGRVLVLRRLRERVEPGLAASPAASRALTEIQAFFCDPALMTGLLTAQGYRAEDRAAAVLLAGEVPAETALALLVLLDDEPEALDPAVAESLRTRLAADHALQLLALAGGSRPALRRIALERIVPCAEDLRHLRELRKHAEPEWRLLAVAAMARGGGSDPVAGLADALDDPMPEIRMAAAEALGRRGGHSALEPLLRLVAARGFDQRSVEERCCILLAAGRAAPREVWPVLARLVERRRFGRPRRWAWTGEPALEALARLPEPVPTLLRDRWRDRPDLRAALHRVSGRADTGHAGAGGHDGTADVDQSKAA